jgi:NADPH2:quinone reductase
MKAAYYERKGPAQAVLVVGELPDPEPGPGEVRVRVHCSAVNPSDTKGRSGWDGNMEMPAPRIIPHQDGAGVIDRVGPGVAKSRIGERVWIYEANRDGRAFGTCAEYTVVPSKNAVRLPDGIGFDWGACFGIPGMTAHRCLFIDGAIQGHTVLVSGGAGAVGTAAIQLAKWAGARVITTVSRAEQEAVVKAAGAHVIINRKTEDVAARIKAITSGEGVDRVVEVAFTDNYTLNSTVLKTNGVISTYSSVDPNAEARFPFRQTMVRGFNMHFVLVYVMPDEAHQKAAHDVNACVSAGAYKPHIGKRFRLEDAAKAHEAQESGTVIGKIIIEIP